MAQKTTSSTMHMNQGAKKTLGVAVLSGRAFEESSSRFERTLQETKILSKNVDVGC